ncbi:MAG: response regulator [Burkholderiales bacterium]|nr:MAG: response regulator [Burkholderiales bacterium]
MVETGRAGDPDPLSSDIVDPRPRYRVAVFGLARKFERLLEIVLRHARHNSYRYVLSGSRGPGGYDIAVVDMTAKGGPEIAETLRKLPDPRPVVTLGRRNDPARGCDDLLHRLFSAQVLGTLNRAVERQLLNSAALAPAAAGLGAMPGMRRAAAPRAGSETGSAQRTTRLRALIVDDSATVRRQLALALQQMGIDSEGVGLAQEALDVLSHRRYDIVFVDVVMPEMDGYKLTREIKRDRELRRMPVVILTSRSSPFDLARGALAGCNSYLVKPVSMRALRDTVIKNLRRTARLVSKAQAGALRSAGSAPAGAQRSPNRH